MCFDNAIQLQYVMRIVQTDRALLLFNDGRFQLYP